MTHPLELMAVLCAREVREADIFGVGIQSVIAATGAVLAKHALTPGARLISRPLPGAELVAGAREPHQLAMAGRLDLFFLTPAQIDAGGDVNFERLRQADGRWKELSGAFAVPVYYACVKRVVLMAPDHSPAVFVPKVDRITASAQAAARETRTGGLYRILTSKAVLGWNTTAARLELISTHPGETVASVQAATGFALPLAADFHETPDVTPQERAALEEKVYPALAGFALPWRSAPAQQ